MWRLSLHGAYLAALWAHAFDPMHPDCLSGHRSVEWSHWHLCAVVDDSKRAIEALVDFDAGLGVAAAVGEDLQHVRTERDGMVVGDDARVLEAEDAIRDELGGPGTIRPLRPGCRPGKARIVAPEESGEKGVRGVFGGDARKTQFRNEPILQGAKDALNAALGLRTGGGHPVDPEFLQEASHLSRGARALELFFEAPVRVAGASEDAMAIGVGGEGEARAAGELAEDVEVAGGRFRIVKPAGEDLAGRIIDGGMEDESGATVFEPGMMAAVELDEHAFLGHAIAAGAMLWRAAPAGAGDAGMMQEATDGLARDPQSFPLAEEFGEVLVIHRGISGASEPHDPLAQGIGQTPGRGAPAIGVG